MEHISSQKMGQSLENCLWRIPGRKCHRLTMIVASQGSSATDGQAGQLASGWYSVRTVFGTVF